ncbi:hypothetical protein HID58_042938, partial [Brassica napus]
TWSRSGGVFVGEPNGHDVTAWTNRCFNGHVFGLNEDGHVDVVVPLILMAWKWIIRKNHHVGPSKCSKGGHHCHTGMGRCPHGGDWSELAESLMDKPGTQDFSLHFLRLSGSMNCVEECMGQDPRILRGRILARLRIRGMRRFNKTWRPKLRILMLDSTSIGCVFVPVSLLCLAYLMLLELLVSSRDWGTFSMFVLVLGDNLVDSWYRSRILRHDPGHVFLESEDLEIHPSETHGSWVRFFINRRLYGLSSRNLKTGWTFILELEGWMDYRPRIRRVDGLSLWNPEAGWTLVLEPVGCRVNPFFKPGGFRM